MSARIQKIKLLLNNLAADNVINKEQVEIAQQCKEASLEAYLYDLGLTPADLNARLAKSANLTSILKVHGVRCANLTSILKVHGVRCVRNFLALMLVKVHGVRCVRNFLALMLAILIYL